MSSQDRNRRGRLEGKVAVITGGNSGIGLATSELFKAEGAKIALIGRDSNTVLTAVASLGGDTLGFSGDVSSTKDLESFYAQVKERFGRIDILFANAGIAASMPFAATSEELLKQVLDINVKGVFYTVQKALPLLSKGSSVILTTSIVNQLGMAGTSAYAASKAAVRAFVRVFAAELVDQGIRVNAVSPGPTETPILGRSGLSAEQVTQVKDHLENVIPMKRMGTSEEVAKAVLFFASDDSSFTTGEELMVDGGMTQF